MAKRSDDSRKRPNFAGSVRWHAGRERWLATLRLPGKPEMRHTIPPEIAGKNTKKDKAIALDWLEDWRARELAPKAPAAPRTVGEQLDAYLAALKAENGKPRTITARSVAVERLRAGIGHARLVDLKAVHIRRLERDLTAKGYSANYVRLIHYTLSGALGMAISDGYIAASPILGVKPPKSIDRIAPIVGVDVPLPDFLAAIAGRAFESAFVVALACGLRNHELRALRWADVDLAAGELRVSAGAQPSDKGEIRGGTKSPSGIRRVAFGQVVAAAFGRARTVANERKLKAGDGWKDAGLVWPNTTGGIVDESRLEKALAAACKTAGITAALEKVGLTPLRVHDLRHAFVTLALEGDVDLATVSRAAGHQSVRVTSDTYAHATVRADRKVADALDAVFGRADKSEREKRKAE